jgi:GSH-dependent disulfide-bond oxidoreductase
MTELSRFPITQKWPAQHPDLLQLYSLPTPNGVKVSIMLEECGLAYEPHRVAFENNDQMSSEFRSLNPNNKIPAIIDPNGPGGRPLALWESGAILIYLGEKTGKFLPADPAARYETIQWLMFQMGGRSVSSTNSPARPSRTSGRAIATWTNRSACWRC